MIASPPTRVFPKTNAIIPTSVHARVAPGEGAPQWEQRVMRDIERTPEEWLAHLGMDREYARGLAKSDLYFLQTEVLGYTFYFEPFHRPICERYQQYDRLSMWLVPRDHLKTTTITIGGSIQEILIDPNIQILITSSKLSITRTIMEDLRRKFVQCERLLFLFPEYRIEEEDLRSMRWQEWNTPARTRQEAKEYTFTAGAVDSSVTSKHFDIIKADDLVTEDNVKTAEGLERVKDHFKRLWPCLRPGIGRMVVIGTRWDQDDCYQMIIDRMQGAGAMIYIRRALERGAGGKLHAIFPQSDYGQPMYTKSVLRERRLTMGDYDFFCQYMNDPIPDKEHRVVHPEQIQRVTTIPDGCFNFVFCDPAVSSREAADRFAIICVAVDYDFNFYVRDCIADHLQPSQAAQWIYEFAVKYRPQFVMMETLAFQDVYRSHLETLIAEYGVRINIVEAERRGNEEKFRRIFGLQPIFEQRRMFFLQTGRGVDKVIREVLQYSKKLSKQQRDDIIDALSDAPRSAYAPPRPVGFGGQHLTVAEHFASMAHSETSRAFNAMDFTEVT